MRERDEAEPEDDSPQASCAEDIAEQLANLDAARDRGVVDDEEYERTKERILDAL